MGNSLPIFPLQNVVLFPRVRTPLHLFEPRYRQLAEHVLEGERRIGMVAVRPEHFEEMSEDPPIYPVGCSGVVTESNRRPDGRYDIVLLGEHRFRILDEPTRPAQRGYRVAQVERLEDRFDPSEADRVARMRSHIVEHVGVLLRRSKPARASALGPEFFSGVDDETFVNTLSNAFSFPPEEKYDLLATDSIPDRFARLAALLSFRRAELKESRGDGPRTLH